MKPYPKYKDSGIEWIGEVPDGWEVKRIKYFFRLITEKNCSLQMKKVALENIESWTGHFIDSKGDYQGEGILFRKGDVLFGKLRPYLAKVLNAEFSGASVGDIFVMRPEFGISSRFAFYRFLSKPFIDIVDGSTFGAKMPRVSWNFIANLPIAVPSHDEQTAIAAYLDRKTAQIDDLISKKQKLIELLKEERAAIINQAVTKGLNPDAPMKNSGVEWLGEIPAHWEVKRLKYIAGINEENLPEKTDVNLEIKYIDIGNVCLGSIVKEPVTMHFKDAPSRARRIVKKGDTIISTVRTYLKAISYISDVPQNLIVSTGFAVIKPGDDFDKKFISFLLTSEMIVDTICSLSVGVSYPAINASDIANIMIWFPPNKTEQAAIVEHVNKTTTKIDQTTSKIEKQIDLLKEFRTALISEVVTGKIDVRDEGSNG